MSDEGPDQDKKIGVLSSLLTKDIHRNTKQFHAPLLSGRRSGDSEASRELHEERARTGSQSCKTLKLPSMMTRCVFRHNMRRLIKEEIVKETN